LNYYLYVVIVILIITTTLITELTVAIAQALVAGLSPQRLGFAPRSVHVRFVVDKVALGRVFVRVLGVLPHQYYFTVTSHSYVIWGIDNGARWWQQLKDIVSPHLHEKYTNNNINKNEIFGVRRTKVRLEQFFTHNTINADTSDSCVTMEISSGST
jgi:hypothetical protein